MTDNSETKSLEAKCYCGTIHFTLSVPVESLPLRTYLCHCSLCRYSTGAPCIFHAPLDKGLKPEFIAPSSADKLTRYQPGNDCTYDFCSTCGCHVAGVSFDREEWTIATSIFKDHSPEIFKISSHVFSKSGPGGALPSVLSHVNGHKMGDYNPPEDDPTSKLVIPEAEVGPDGQERLRAKCHCGGVSFTIGRPTQKIHDDNFMSKYVSQLDKNKWMAIYDICDDCRLVNGTHLASWTFVPLSLTDPPIKTDLQIGTAKTYKSSEGVLRSFCGTCGATVFFSCGARNPTEEQAVVDIATGILRCPEGVMGDNWLTWRARLAFEGSGMNYDKGLAEALRDGMITWTKEKYGVALTTDLP